MVKTQEEIISDYNLETTTITDTIAKTKKQMKSFVEKVREQQWLGITGKPIRDIINIGIGGSDLGPKMVTNALAEYSTDKLRCYFISDIDYAQIEEIQRKVDPERTLIIICSKTFTTTETLLNARTMHKWLGEKLNSQNLSQHFIAVTAAIDRAKAEFAIPDQQIFPY